jgi:hypothetical protein
MSVKMDENAHISDLKVKDKAEVEDRKQHLVVGSLWEGSLEKSIPKSCANYLASTVI